MSTGGGAQVHWGPLAASCFTSRLTDDSWPHRSNLHQTARLRHASFLSATRVGRVVQVVGAQ